MAVFLVNTCKFNSCGLTFPTLTELIRHIEETHLDFDPRTIEQHELQQPSCLPISYILRVFTDSSRKESPGLTSGNAQPRKVMRSHSPALSLCSTTPTGCGSEMDEEDNESDSGESSIDSWVNINVENDSANAILKIMSPQSCQTGTNSLTDEKDKPYVCLINGCKKRYRNANGLKYHAKKVHNSNNNNNTTTAQKKELISSPKVYKCQCGKIYKTSHGLKNHNNQHHSNGQQQQQQTQTATQTPSQAQPFSGIINKTAVIASNSLSPISKESILATFVRMKTIPTATPNANSGSGVQLNRNGLDGLPLMLTLQTDNENKHDSESVNNDDKVINNENGLRKCPVIAAPTLQQHLLSPIVGKPTISVTKII